MRLSPSEAAFVFFHEGRFTWLSPARSAMISMGPLAFGFEAAATGARLRFRPVMMTSFAFILGLLPLVIAVGAGATSRRAVGTPVFGGMLAGLRLGHPHRHFDGLPTC
jgi:hypothetical protein